MKRLKPVISLLLAGSLIGLVGCGENQLKEKEAKASEQQGKITNTKNQVEKKEEKPVVVNIVEPETKKIIKSFIPKDFGYKTDIEQYKVELEKWAKELARGTEAAPGYDERMILDKIDANGQVIKGSPQTVLDEEELTDRLLQASEKGGNVELPLYVTASGYNVEDVSHLGEVVVAAYTTKFNSNVAGRTKNIELSAQAINNLIIGNGDSFSFNTTVGPSDAAHGYQKAEEIMDGKLVEGYGGGICQTSSTLFNAVDQLGVSYIEKHNHSLHVGYVPTGRDATVSYGGKDFRFKNTTGVPLLVKAIVGKGTLTIELRTSRIYSEQMKKAV
ncbi:VanW family protein [Neobacillus dielmonensis]|uniref:VanW family protein n=1 Tax=Neobacillus dielmonensis TaxID=1347369 RepID=UPI0005A92636|nr:VanW family protein [Neobacillus dielmonensis]